MQQNTIREATSVFAKEVKEGLMSFPKYLSSKYFYDELGDSLFQDIMAMPEYYLTDCEFDILQNNKSELAKLFSNNVEDFTLFELGAGDGKKTKILLEYLYENGFKFDYRPIDISQNALDKLHQSITSEIPGVIVKPLQGTYFDTLKAIDSQKSKRKIILFLGSNIGNLLHEQAIDFLSQLRAVMNDNDFLFIGMDQKKNPQTILDAYNDPTGITKAFNKNILSRINKELGGNFNLNTFTHWEVYNPETGTAKSYLVSKEAQKVFIEDLQVHLEFDAWETIHTEISQKYDDKTVKWISGEANFEVLREFTDERGYYKNYLFKSK